MGGRRTQYHRLSALTLLMLATQANGQVDSAQAVFSANRSGFDLARSDTLRAGSANADSASTDQENLGLPSSTTTPDMELLLFLGEWSDHGEWVDPIGLDQAMKQIPNASADENDHEAHDYEQ